MPVDDQILAKWVGGIGLSVLAGWIASSLRIGRTIGKYEQRFATVEKDVGKLKDGQLAITAEQSTMKTTIAGCINLEDCLERQEHFSALIQRQFNQGTREFDEIKKMIQDGNDATNSRIADLAKVMEDRHTMWLNQLLLEKRGNKTNVSDGQ